MCVYNELIIQEMPILPGSDSADEGAVEDPSGYAWPLPDGENDSTDGPGQGTREDPSRKLVPAPSGEDGAVENASGGPAEDPTEQAALPPSHGGDAAGDPAETQKDEEAPTDPYLTDKAEGFQNRNIF